MKTIIGQILYLKPESAPNTGASMSAQNAIEMVDAPTFEITYALTGERSGVGGAYSGGSYPRSGATGRQVNATVRLAGKGRGSAYSVSDSPPGFHDLLRACGLSGSFEGSTWFYRPYRIGTSVQTLAAEVYSRGELLTVSGSVGTFTVAGNDGSEVVFEFNLQGGVGSPIVDVANVPPIAPIGLGVVPPVNTNIQLTISGSTSGVWTGSVVRGWSFDEGLEIAPRLDRNRSSGTAGYALGRRTPVLTVTIEQPSKTEFDADLAYEQATLHNISLVVGSVAGNRFGPILSGSQIIGISRTEDGPVATLEIQFQPTITTPISDTDVCWRWF